MTDTLTSSGDVIALLTNVSISEENLLVSYASLRSVPTLSGTDKKLLAEVCYLLALNYKRLHHFNDTRRYADESIALYKELQINTQEKAAPILFQYLPDLMHEGVVAQLLA